MEKVDANEDVVSENQDSDLVEIHEASIEDLDSALENAMKEEAQTAESETNATEETEVQSPAVQTAQPEAQKVATQGADTSKPRTYTEEEVQAIQAENARYKKEGNQKELFIQQRNSEYGNLKSQYESTRQQLLQIKNQLVNGLEDRFSESPVEAINDRDKIKEIDQQLNGLDVNEERAGKIVDAQTFFLQNIDIEKVTLDDVSEVLRADGVDDRYIQQFKANPWEFTTPEALVQMGKRATDRKEFITADNDRRVLANHVLHLNEEIQKLKAKPGQIMNRVQKQLNQMPSVNSARSSSVRTVIDLDPTKMTLKELNEALAHADSH